MFFLPEIHFNSHLNNPKVGVEPKKNQGQLARNLGHLFTWFSSAGQGWRLSWKQRAGTKSASWRERFARETRDLPETQPGLAKLFVVFTLSEEGAIKVLKPHWPPVTPYHHFIRLTPSPPGACRKPATTEAWPRSLCKFCLVLTDSVFHGAKISPCLGDSRAGTHQRRTTFPAPTVILLCF